MKKVTIILALTASVAFVSCDRVQRNPSASYMPDMGHSRALETYSDESELKEAGINFNNTPVSGALARGEEMPFPIKKDKAGDTASYFASRSVPNPIKTMSEAELKEAERLYLIHCGICHGQNADGNGPLYKGGDGPYPAAPRNLTDEYSVSMPDGQMFYSITYGKNLMGPYASQVNRKERWMIINYIRHKQGKTFDAGSKDATQTAGVAPKEETKKDETK